MRVEKCPKCAHPWPRTVDGAECGGLPGIKYKVCDGCGHATAITRRPTKRDNLRGLR